MNPPHLHWIELSREAVHNNLSFFRSKVNPGTKIMAMVKANAYGHGLEPMATTIANQADWFGVNTLPEALTVRRLLPNAKILITGPVSVSDIASAVTHSISLCAHSLEYLRSQAGSGAAIHLKINTGTNRLGLEPGQVAAALEIAAAGSLAVEGVYTHFHSADSGSPATDRQFALFTPAVTQVKSAHPRALAHCASTSAILNYPHTHLDMVRLGIGLYGLWPDPHVAQTNPAVTLHPVLSWKCVPIQSREIAAGQSVSYSATFTYPSPGNMAVLPVGYSDGFDRGLSNCGHVWADGHLYPVIGRVAMNFSMIDTSAHPLGPDTQIQLIGPDNRVENMATTLGTINYEVVSRIHPSIPRLLV